MIPSSRIVAPTPPQSPPPAGFPLLATLAPVVVSVAIWLVTGSVFALVFAALGPAVAVASVMDARLRARRMLRSESGRFASELAHAEGEVRAAHDRERAALDATVPSARVLVESRWPRSEHWLATLDEPVPVALGRGTVPSGVQVDGAAAPHFPRTPADESLLELSRVAAFVPRAPVVVDARLGIGIHGPRVAALAAARAVVVQLAAALSPATHRIAVDPDELEGEWSWLPSLPHDVSRLDGAQRALLAVRSQRPGRDVVLAVAGDREALPSGVRVVVAVRGGGAVIEHHPDHDFLAALRVGGSDGLRLDQVSREEAAGWAVAVAARARSEQLVGVADRLPAALAFADCGERVRGDTGSSLDAVVGVTGGGPLRLDLVAQGPHAVVGGTTGSGKSELLIAWVLAMAAAWSPRRFTVLLVDFKGGSAFAALEALPHCVGMITDLDEIGAVRALESIAAELRRRERHLAASRARSIDDLAEGARLARLVIVVDEFAAMVAGFPDLHALFSDIAARGRSLGVHLVLCTQRPAGVIRDAVLANSALRVSLRVNNRADSSAVIGSDAAADLPLSPRGRALVSVDAGEPVLAQVPLVTAADIAQVAATSAHERGRPHRPWLDPLPPRVSVADLPAGTEGEIVFGLLDDPRNQAQPPAVYRPVVHGNLLVVGGAGSGKSTLLATLAAGGAMPVEYVPSDIEGAWDTLVAAVDGIRAATGPVRGEGLLLVDDLDVLLARFPEEYETAVLDLVSQALREGPARGIRFVVTVQRLAGGVHTLAGLCGSRLLLGLPSRQEHVLAGGDGAHFVDRRNPGSGTWAGLRVQVATAGADAASLPSTAASRAPVDTSRPLAVVTTAGARFVEQLRGSYPAFARPGAVAGVGALSGMGAGGLAVSGGAPRQPRAVVGDPDEWQANWGALAALRATHTVLVHGCTAAEFRSVTRVRALPPPLARGGDSFWQLTPDGAVRRAALRPPRTVDSAG